MNAEPIWITGVGVVSALGCDFNSFAQSLRRGDNPVAPITAFDASAVRGNCACEVRNFDSTAHFSRRELRRMDRSSCMLQVATREAMTSAALTPGTYDPQRCGVALGSLLGGMINATEYYSHALATGKGKATQLMDYPLYVAGARVCAEFGFLGPNVAFSTACSSGNLALGAAADMLRLNEADVVITGGFDALTQMNTAGFNIMRNVAPDLCRPFDKNRQGLVLGEGAGVLILETAAHGRSRGARPLAYFLGYGMSSDAYHMTAPDVTGRGPARAITAALHDANIEPQAIDYINAHGTGTVPNDAAETRAIKRALGSHANQVAISSTKPMHGHAMGASGALEAIAVVAGMRDGFIPPTINYREPDPQCDLDYVPNVARNQRINLALSNNYGFGGNNCSIVLGNIKHD